jgi:Ca2+-dependent lipid-binding protein
VFFGLSSSLKKPVGILEVTIISAKNLLKMDLTGKADPYVKLRLVNTLMSKKTKTKMNTLSPEWNETFKLLVQDPKSQSLQLHVYDWDRVSLIFVPVKLLENLWHVYYDLNHQAQ